MESSLDLLERAHSERKANPDPLWGPSRRAEALHSDRMDRIHTERKANQENLLKCCLYRCTPQLRLISTRTHNFRRLVSRLEEGPDTLRLFLSRLAKWSQHLQVGLRPLGGGSQCLHAALKTFG